MAQVRKKNWWGRNWKWCVPGCCLGSVLFFVGAFVLMIFLIMGMVKSAEPVAEALDRAKQHPQVQAAIGSPIKEGFTISCNIKTGGSSGTADMSIPVSGPKGKATIYAIAEKSAGAWSFSSLTVEIKGTGERIVLVEQEIDSGRLQLKLVE